MAILRLLYRRFNLIAAILVATSLWVLYLIVSAPAASDQRYVNAVMPHVDMDQFVKPSVTRKVAVGLGHDQQYFDKVVDKIKDKNHNIVPPPPQDDGAIPAANQGNDKPAIPRPPSVDNMDNKPVEAQAGVIQKNDSKTMNANSIINNVTKVESLPKINNETKGPVLIEMEKKVIELGVKMKNKTIEDWESVKNKTLEKLTDLGVIQKPKYVKLVYRPVKWNLNISLETIGFIMKDTEFLLKKQNLTEMEYQPLLAPNSTLRVNMNSSYGLGFCDCEEFSCVCCVRMFNKWMGLNSTSCSKITFESKSQELKFEYSVDKYPVFSEKIAAEFPPKICMESTSKAVGTCVLFSNVTSKVAVDNEDHKLHLSGCLEYDLTLYNKTLSAFPVACFQIPNTQVTHEDNKARNLGNFMP